MNNYNEICRQRLSELIEEKDVTAREVALRGGIDPSTISKHISGQRSFGTEALISYADYFDVSIDYLVGRTDTREVNRHNEELKEEYIHSEILSKTEDEAFSSEQKKIMGDMVINLLPELSLFIEQYEKSEDNKESELRLFKIFKRFTEYINSRKDEDSDNTKFRLMKTENTKSVRRVANAEEDLQI